MQYHNMFRLGCPKCHQYLETTTDLSPVQFLDGCTLSVVQNRVPLHMVRQWNFTTLPQRNERVQSFMDPDWSSQKGQEASTNGHLRLLCFQPRTATGTKMTASRIGKELASQLTCSSKGRSAN